MLDESRPDDAESWQCAHCAARFAAPLLFCPSCGASQRAAPSQSPRPRVKAERLEPGTSYDASYSPPRHFLDRWRAFRGVGKVGVGGEYAIDYSPIDEDDDQGSPRSRRRFYIYCALAASAFVFVAYAVVPGSVTGALSGAQVMEGVVRTSPDPSADLDSATSMSRRGLNMPGDNTADTTDNDTDDDAGASADADRAAPPRADANIHADADISRQLALVRADLGKNSLWPARRALHSALARQPGNVDAERLLAELGSRERERDALLGHARVCARSGQWACVRQYAGRATSVDTSSREARRLLARASGNHEEVVVRHSPPPSPAELFGRLRRWFNRSVAQNRARPTRSVTAWERP